jgi:ribulose-phosphate 3-epimerase
MIIPAILEKTFTNFERQAKILSFAPLIQIDVMDGEFVPNKSFEEIEKINDLNLKNQWELHLMVNHPLKELEKWKMVKNIKRIIFHIECDDHPQKVITAIKKNGYEVGMAINPETDKYDILPYISQIDEVLFMTVHPGQQGAPFVPEVQDNVIELKKILDIKHTDLIIAADGAIKKDNIQKIKNWGVNNFCVGSAITLASDPKEAYEELLKLI